MKLQCQSELWSDLALYWERALLTAACVPPVVLIQSPEVSGLNGVRENGAVMIRSFTPQQLHPCVSDLFHPDYTGRPRNTWIKEVR